MMNPVVLFSLIEDGEVQVFYEHLDRTGAPRGPSIRIRDGRIKMPIDMIAFANETPFGLVVLKEISITYDGDTTNIVFLRKTGLFRSLVRQSYASHNIASLHDNP